MDSAEQRDELLTLIAEAANKSHRQDVLFSVMNGTAAPQPEENLYLRAGRELTRLRAALARSEAALQSIAANTCCDRCQEAALVARAALRKEPDNEGNS